MGGRAQYGAKWGLLLILITHLIAILFFINGYLLNRIHLPERSKPYKHHTCARPYKKVVWIVIDALRYDFVVSDDRYPCSNSGRNNNIRGGGNESGCPHQGQMPKLQSLLSSNPDATRTFRYIAEAPTTTTQRLKSMVSGGLPTFFDISNAFTARPIDEDNLIDQMTSSNWSLAFMGDTTWTNLFPTSFNNFSQSFPCFNVKDLDTVDDGIWKILVPTLQRPDTWDVLIAHYLGVDHAGHAHGVHSVRMQEKLKQMDEHIAAVVEEMKKKSGKDGDFEDALLLIAGDHGQTMGGDHGGGSPEEVDSVLVAVDIANVAATTSKKKKNMRNDSSGGERAACLESCTCGEDKNQCAKDLPQIDLVPTLAAMLNLPIPFGNMGKFSPELWSLAAHRCRGGVGGSGGSRLEQDDALLRATAANAEQVHRYLNTYASHKTARFPAGELKNLNAQFDALPSLDNSNGSNALEAAIDANMEFLNEAQLVAQQVWTQFNDLSMVVGFIVFAASLVIHLRFTWKAYNSLYFSSIKPPKLTTREVILICIPWMGVIIHFIGTFSFFYLLSEGRCTALILLVVTGLITAVQTFFSGESTTNKSVSRRSNNNNSGGYRRSSSSSQLKLAVLGMLAAVCISISSYLGLLGHSGYGFWQRLTVHEPREGDISLEKQDETSNRAGHQGTFFKSLFASTVDLSAYLVTLPSPHVALLGKYLINYGIPAFFLHQLIFAQLKKSDNVDKSSFLGRDRLLNFLITVSFLILGMHDVLEQQILTLNSTTIRDIPLNLFLPRVVLLTGSAALVLALLTILGRKSRQANYFYSNSVIAILGSILPIMLLLSNTVTPLIALLCAIEAMALTALVAARSTSIVAATTTTAAVFALLQTHVFFVTGHLPEFAGVQYTAGFVGYEEFHLVRSAALVVLDTFGGLAIAGLGLVVVAAVFDGQNFSSNSENTSRKPTRTKKTDPKAEKFAVKASRKGSLRLLLLLFGLNRAVAAFCATLSAGIQRRHLYAWSLFAPRFVFEVLFLALTDVLLVVLAWWTGC